MALRPGRDPRDTRLLGWSGDTFFTNEIPDGENFVAGFGVVRTVILGAREPNE
jgi:hypothetical protein